ncbi:MFS transporter [Mangrovibacillus cuniculi]|uniref:MFS transporter n=1 Tax=Mangrovibacillus cuniculi TaxID=2593652 RepID=A0A7S8CD61_9BACI|nr:MFS transporter [Mangrovibacillus cuniculi]QPC47819.1 MFS transporter [Mangrovibacillus cuniculi]
MTLAKSRFIYLAFMLSFAECVRGAFIIGYLPTFATDQLHTSIAIVGVAVSVHFVFDALSNVFIGFWMECFGEKRVLRVSYMVMFFGLFCMWYYPSYMTALAGAACLGVGLCPVWIYILAKVKGKERGSKMGVIYLAWLVGLSVGALSINVLIQFATMFSFWLLVSSTFASYLLFELFTQERIIESTPSRSLKREWVATLVMIRKGRVVYPGILLQGVAVGMLLPILPSFIYQELRLSPTEYSMLLVVGGVLIGISLIPMGKFADLVGRKIPILLGFMTLAAGILGVIVISSFQAAIVAAAIIGVAYALLMPAWNSFLSTFIPDQSKSSGWGILSGIQGLGGMVGPMVGALVTVYYSTDTAFLISGVLLMVAAAYYGVYFLREKW